MADETELNEGTTIVDDDTAAANAAALAEIAEKPSDGDAVSQGAAADKTDDATPAEDAPPKPRADKWAIDEITALRAKNREMAAEAVKAAQLQAERDHWKALAEQANAGAAPPAAPPRTTPQPGMDEFQTAVKAEASRLAFLKECEDVAAVGGQTYKDWNETLGIVNAIGASSDDFLQDVFAADRANAHAILHELANDPTTARRMVNMDSRQRIGALVKMAVKLEAERKPAAKAASAPPPKALSQAPAPLSRMEPGNAAPDADLYAEIPDAQWSRAWDAKYGARRAAQ